MGLIHCAPWRIGDRVTRQKGNTMTTSYVDAPEEAADLATRAVDLGWRVSVVNPDPDTYSLRLYRDAPRVALFVSWFGSRFVLATIFRGSDPGHGLPSLYAVKRFVEDQARS